VSRFLLLLSPTGRESPRPAEAWWRRLSAYSDWVARGRSAGLIQGGGALAERSARISRAGAATTVVECGRDDPGALASYFVIEAADWPEAVAVATACPAADPGTMALFRVEPGEIGPSPIGP